MEKQIDEKVAASRRRFLKTAGKLAVYVPPAMLAISKPSFATFSQSSGVDYKHKDGDGHHSGSWSRFLNYLFGWLR